MARMFGPRAAAEPLPIHGPNLEQAEAAGRAARATGGPIPAWALGGHPAPAPPPRSYQDAMYEALDQVHKLGLDGDLAMPSPAQRDPSDVVRYVYGQGWLACETRLACPEMADLIADAIARPADVTPAIPGDRGITHQVRAVQQIVAYGVKMVEPS